MSELEKYIEAINREKQRHEDAIGVSQRAVARCEEKLKNPAKWFERECKRNSKRARIAKGEDFPRRAPPVRKPEPAPEPRTEQAPAPAKPKSWL